MVQKFYRSEPTRKASGLGYTEFYRAIKEGLFPKPDGYLGPRSPFWTETTITKWQRDTIAAGKPVRAPEDA